MKNSRKLSFMVTFSGLMIAISIILKFLTYYVPIAGAMVLRLDLYGPFEKMPAMVFGPVVGGIVAAIVDLLGFFFANKTMNGYIFFLTITAFLNCFAFGLIWKYSKNMVTKRLEIAYLIVCSFMFIYGGINYAVIMMEQSSKYKTFLTHLNESGNYFSVGLMVVGLIGMVIYGLNWLICKLSKDNYLRNNYFRVFVALIIPGMIISIINTEILKLFIPTLQNKVFLAFLIPRLIGQIFETFYEAYIICILIPVSRPLFRKRDYFSL
jgi:hypothetical protein